MNNSPFNWRTYESQIPNESAKLNAAKRNAAQVSAAIEKKRKEGGKVWKIDLTPKVSHIYSKARPSVKS